MSTSTDAGAGTLGTAPTPQAGAARGPRAGFWARFGAILLDGLILGVPFGILMGIFPDAIAILYLLYFVAQIAYYVMLEGGPTGQTLGKKALGIRVYDLKQGGPIGPGRAFLRWLGRIPSGVVLALGYLWMLWDGEKQTWHDKIAGSVVVPERDYPL